MAEAEEIRNVDVAVERSDVSVRLVATIAFGLAVTVALSGLVIGLIYPHALHGPSDAPRLVTAAPRLQIDPAADLQAYRAAQRRVLESYGWVDRQRGIVHIPIEQAMREVAAGGIKDWPEDAR